MSLCVNTTHSAIRLVPASRMANICRGDASLGEQLESELELRLLCARRRCFDAPICMAGR